MKHNERLKLAKEIAKKISEKYKKDILSIGIFGSTARNEDNEFSDLEVIAITKQKHFFKQYKCKDILVLELGIPLKKAIRMIRKVDIEWSLKPGYLIHQKIIFGSKKIVNKFREETEKINEKDLIKVADSLLLWMHDNLNKIKAAARGRNRGKLLVPLAFYTIEANLFVGLLNKHIYARQYFDALKEAKSLKLLPKNYANLMKILYESTDLEEINKAASQLYVSCDELLQQLTR